MAPLLSSGHVRASRPLLSRCATVALGSLLQASIVHAQAAPAPPDYRVLRYDESWTFLRNEEPRDPFDLLKYIPLDRSGTSFLSIGGQLRTRAEGFRNFLLTDAATNRDSFGLVRAMLHADLHATEYLRLFLEGKHSVAISRDLPGGRRPLDQDEWEIQNAFVELGCCGGQRAGLALRVGRQELLLGSQRLVSPLDWSNTRRSFEGARLLARADDLTADAFLTRPVAIRTADWNRRDTGSVFWGTIVRPSAPAGIAWELYLLGLHQEEAALWGYEGEHDRYTLGGRATGGPGATALRFDVEGGWQFGELAGNDVVAFFIATDLSRAFAQLPLRPTLAVGADFASGDADRADDRVGTFHHLFPLGHAYAGYMDLLGRQNLIELRGVITAGPTATFQTRASLHRFLRASRDDAVYNVGGGVFRPAAPGPRAIGTELNLSAAYRWGRHVRFEGGYGHFSPGGFLDSSSPAAVGADWVFVSSTFTF